MNQRPLAISVTTFFLTGLSLKMAAARVIPLLAQFIIQNSGYLATRLPASSHGLEKRFILDRFFLNNRFAECTSV